MEGLGFFQSLIILVPGWAEPQEVLCIALPARSPILSLRPRRSSITGSDILPDTRAVFLPEKIFLGVEVNAASSSTVGFGVV
jgi:hypothetical protein